MNIKSKSFFVTTLSFSAAIGLAILPNDSYGQRGSGSRGGGDSYNQTPSDNNRDRGGSDRYNNSSNRYNSSSNNYSGNRYNSSNNNYSRPTSTPATNNLVDYRLKKNIELVDSLADKMVWRARFDMFRGGSERAFKAVSNHAELTNTLVKASHGTCPIALKKAALAVDANIKTMSDRRTSRVQTTASRTCGTTVQDPLLSLINESKIPSSKIVNRVTNGGGRHYSSPAPIRVPAPVAARPLPGKPVVVREITPADVIFTLFRKHLN